MSNSIQTTLDSKLSVSNGNSGNGKEFRLEEVFIACLLLAKTAEEDTYRDILRKIAEYAPMIRLKNEAMIKCLLNKLEDIGAIQMINTRQSVKIIDKFLPAEEDARDFFKKISKYGDFLQ